MPGPRRDKERAWQALEDSIEGAVSIIEAQSKPDQAVMIAGYAQELRNRLADLKDSGRLDRRQITLIRSLIKTLWSFAWRCAKGEMSN